jgi:hypothetical protein
MATTRTTNTAIYASILKVVSNLKGKIPLGRPRHRWEDNIKIYL